MNRFSASCRRHWDMIALAGIVLLGGWLRLSRLDLMEFKPDVWRLHALAVEQAEGHMQLVGLMSSVGFHNPPMPVYLFSIPALVSKDPVFVAALAPFLSTVAIALGYFLARKWMSRGAALAAMALFAASPWVVVESRKIWQQNLLSLFTVCFFLAAVNWLRKGQLRQILAISAVISVLTQLHPQTLALWPLVALLAWRRRKTGNAVRMWLAGAALFLLLWTPYMVFLLKGGIHEFSIREIGRASEESYAARFANGVLWQPQMMGYGRFEALLGRSAPDFLASSKKLQAQTALFGLLLAGGFIVALRRARSKEIQLLILWPVLTIVLTSFHATPFHYLIVCYPSTFLLAGMLIDSAGKWIGARIAARAARPAVLGACIAGMLLVVADETVFLRRFMGFVSDRGVVRGEYGVPYRHKLSIARHLSEYAPEEEFLFIDRSGARHTEVTYRYLYELAGGEGRMVCPEEVAKGAALPTYLLLGSEVTPERGLIPKGLAFSDEVAVGPFTVRRFAPCEAPD